MNIRIDDHYSITEITAADKAAYLQHLAEKEIHDQTLNIPHPYTEADADWWINHVAEETKRQGRSVSWAIRARNGGLVGGIGFLGLEPGKAHRGEIGYWLAKPYWGQGVMTNAVKAASELAFKEFGLARITANVFSFNAASARVLEKAGFRLEGVLRKHYKKDGKIFDGKLYAKTADDCNEVAIIRMHHSQVSIPKGSEDEVRGFYCQLLGLQEIQKPDSLKGRGGLWLELANAQVHFSAEDGVERKATKSHVAYEVKGLAVWKTRLQARGIEIGDSIPVPGCDRFEFRDPFGNRVEFLERK